MKRGGEIKRVAEAGEMFNRDGGLRSQFVFCAFFVCRSASKVDPIIVTIPRCMVNDMPAAQASQP